MHLSDAIVRATRPLQVETPTEQRLGTAFWFRRAPQRRPVLITAAHVVRGALRVRVGVGRRQQILGPGAVSLRDDVDMAVLDAPEHPNAWLEPDWIPDFSTLAAIEPVVVLGHPLGLVDSERGTPIARAGITATDPKHPFRGRPEFLVDAPCYPGSSGSPVLRYLPDAPVPIALLGVLIGGPALREEARVGVLQDWPTGDTFHLGVAVDARHLLG